MDANDFVRFVGIPAAVALGGVAVSTLAWRAMRDRIDEGSARFMDDLARGTFAFVFFLLAFTVAEGRENMSRARAVVVEEASVLRQIARQVGPEARASLDAYARSVVEDEWRTLGLRPPTASAESDDAFAAVIDACVARRSPAIDEDLARPEHQRAQRLQLAHAGSPPAYWAVISILMVAGCVLYGVVVSTPARRRALALYLAGFGLVIALVLELEHPFAGLVRVTPEALQGVLDARFVPTTR